MSNDNAATFVNTGAGPAPADNTSHRFAANPHLREHRANMVAAGRAALGLGPNADAATIFTRSLQEVGQLQAQHLVRESDLGGKLSHSFKVNRQLADGGQREATVTVSQGRDPSQSSEAYRVSRIDEQREALLNLDVNTYGMSEQKAIKRLRERLEATRGFDPKTGEPVQVLSGRERRVAEMELANLENSLNMCMRTAALADALQREQRAAQDRMLAEDHAAAQALAQAEAREARVKALAAGMKKAAGRSIGAL